MNASILIGRVTNEIELKHAGDTPYCKFTLAVDRDFQKDKTDFIRCSAWRKTAELVAKYVEKGNLLGVSGRIQTGSYEKDGQKVSTFEVVADTVQFLTPKKERSDFGQAMSVEEFEKDIPW